MKHFKRLLTTLLLMLVAALVAINFYFDGLLKNLDHNVSKIDRKELDISDSFSDDHSLSFITNIALFGVDNNANDSSSLDEARSDAIKIISLDYKRRKLKITSIERDLVVWLPGDHEDYGHLNWAYAYGGSTLALQTLNYNFDLNVDKYVTLSFGALERLVDLLGGIDIHLTSEEIDQTVQPLGIDGPEGTYTLTGAQALSYSRIRKIDNDFARMDRQNTVIMAVIGKLRDLSPLDVGDIVTQILPYINTNLSNFQIKAYLMEMLLFDLKDIETYKEPGGEMEDLYSAYGIGGNYVSSYVDLVKDLHYNIYGIKDYEPSERIYELEEDILYRFGY